jgi:hypothetical protein
VVLQECDHSLEPLGPTTGLRRAGRCVCADGARAG